MTNGLPEPKDPALEATKATVIKAVEAFPVLGPMIGVGINAFGAHTRAKAENAWRDYVLRLKRRVDRLETSEDQEAIWEYIRSEDHAAELFRMTETIIRAREDEKVEAALNSTVNATMDAGAGDPNLREFIAAFIRDCSGMDIRVLGALPSFGTYRRDAEAGDEQLKKIEQKLHEQLGIGLRIDQALLIEGSIGRLVGLSLCEGAPLVGTTMIKPKQRTKLGEEVWRRLNERND